MPKSRKTTMAGFGAMLVAIGTGIVAFMDNDPDTVVNVELISTSIVSFLASLGLFAARDNNVSSEGAKIAKKRELEK